MLLCQTVYLFLPDAHREIAPERRRLVVKSTVGEVSFREPETSRDNEEIKSLKLKLMSVVSGLNRGFVASVDDLQRAETQRLFFASSTNFVYALHLSSFQNGRECAKGLPVEICSIDLEAGDFITAFDYLAEKESLLIGTSRGLLIVHEASKIEAQLDEQMHLYHRLVSTKSDGEESDLEAGIDLLLRQLQQVNAQMQAWVSSGGSEMVSHTLTRHQEIVQDLTQVMFHLILTSFL
ncbi:PREDICTED: uncharacterized protein LOC106319424 isoform X1 [Brassica oleracea var. oleracea]|uniref:Uncharacterized protein n=1 Tax=Brassica oleracea var. oleracea TaxID=109376 RepID=A0A0D3E5I1_BRAOL|nr:PREDICTED: uncharacterized protein LOC106319424 isoform X1 [Brassica oleracea var. oleracea]XP_013613195.1 PREDICTED: uncharacterized protein LOC106319424 isoform X1 [Brassica oleracea var. oleracea]